jgi:hypothetical protein
MPSRAMALTIALLAAAANLRLPAGAAALVARVSVFVLGALLTSSLLAGRRAAAGS